MSPTLEGPNGDTLEERLHFERFLSNLAARFLNVAPDELDDTIQGSLEEFVNILGAERGGLAQFSEDGRALLFTHGYAAPHVTQHLMGADLALALPWYAGQLREGHAVLQPRLPDDLPDEAQAEKAWTASVGLQSNFTLPLCAGGEVVGALGVDYYSRRQSWSPELCSRVELLASVYANALYRRRALTRLREAHDLNRAVLASASSAVLAHGTPGLQRARLAKSRSSSAPDQSPGRRGGGARGRVTSRETGCGRDREIPAAAHE